jgi:phage terminase small subunit
MYSKTATLTPAQKKFAQVYAVTDNATEAVRQAYPKLAGKSTQPSLSVKGHRMLRKVNVMNEIVSQKQQLEAIATKAVDRIDKLVSSDDEDIAFKSSKFAIEQVHGKATQKIESKSAHVSVIYNLGGSSAPEIPADIRKKIEGIPQQR